MTSDTSTPSWAVPGSLDKYGDVICAACGLPERVTSKACRYCCKHKEIKLYEDYDDYRPSYLEADCLICGERFLDPKFILQNFELVRRKESN